MHIPQKPLSLIIEKYRKRTRALTQLMLFT